MPNASGNVLGNTSASRSGHRHRDLVVLEPAGEANRAARRARARLRVVLAAAGRGTRSASAAAPSSPPSSARPRAGELAQRAEVAAPQRRPRSCAGRRSSDPKPTISRRASGCARCTSGQAASSRSMPFETISLPTKITRGPSPAAYHSTASAAASRVAVPRRPAGAPGRLRTSQPRRAAPAAGREQRRCRRPGGPSRTLAFTSGSSTAWRRRSAMWPEPTRMPAAPSAASRA